MLSLFWGSLAAVHAGEFTSSSFKMLDPVINPGSFSTSSSFQLIGVIDQIAIGTSSAASFKVSSGFLFYPFVSSPVVSATAGNASVSLSWTASQGFLGLTVSAYDVGQSTVSGGPYSFTNVGNVTASTRTGLTNGTPYFFVVRALDAFSNPVATSTQVSGTPTAPASSGGGGGGGGGGPPATGLSGAVATSSVLSLRGRASPGAVVNVFKDGVVIGTPTADKDGNWSLTVSTAPGLSTISVYSIDAQNRRSLTASFTFNLIQAQTSALSDVIVPPTITSDKSVVKQGNTITFSGAAYPESTITIVVNSETVIQDKTKADIAGLWSYALNSKDLEKGDHTSKAQGITKDNITTIFSESIGFQVGDIDVPFGKFQKGREPVPAVSACNKNGDINGDKKVNIVDFSILLYFWNQKNPANPCVDINRDGSVNIFDFSIMLFWWTG